MAVMYSLLVTCVNYCVVIYVHCNQYQSLFSQSNLKFYCNMCLSTTLPALLPISTLLTQFFTFDISLP